jgi:RimJ/RimL family protein N-acetyltransferase
LAHAPCPGYRAPDPAEFLGWFHLRPGHGEGLELGYRLRRAAWNHGYATEGSCALVCRGFTGLGLERVFAHTMTVNAASRRVLEKSGLALVRTYPYEGPGPIDGSEHGAVEYALTRAEWALRNGKPEGCGAARAAPQPSRGPGVPVTALRPGTAPADRPG